MKLRTRILTCTIPVVGGWSPKIAFNSVDFPTPFGPTTAKFIILNTQFLVFNTNASLLLTAHSALSVYVQIDILEQDLLRFGRRRDRVPEAHVNQLDERSRDMVRLREMTHFLA